MGKSDRPAHRCRSHASVHRGGDGDGDGDGETLDLSLLSRQPRFTQQLREYWDGVLVKIQYRCVGESPRFCSGNSVDNRTPAGEGEFRSVWSIFHVNTRIEGCVSPPVAATQPNRGSCCLLSDSRGGLSRFTRHGSGEYLSDGRGSRRQFPIAKFRYPVIAARPVRSEGYGVCGHRLRPVSHDASPDEMAS